MNNSWEEFVLDGAFQNGCTHVQLQPGQHLADRIEELCGPLH